jgi:hypothetical protein
MLVQNLTVIPYIQELVVVELELLEKEEMLIFVLLMMEELELPQEEMEEME